MQLLMKTIFTLMSLGVLVIIFTFDVHAQSVITSAGKPATIVNIDVADVSNWLSNAPLENGASITKSVLVLELPLPNGGTVELKAVESPVLKGKVARRYEQIKTYTVHGITDPTIYGKVTISPFGLHAYITTLDGGDFYIEPNGQGVMNITEHKVYFTKDGSQFVHGGPDDLTYEGYTHDHGDGNTHTHEEDLRKFVVTQVGNLVRSDYEVLFVADDTYYNFHKGMSGVQATEDAAVVAAITALMNNINVIYERDLGIRLVTSANNPVLFRSNPTVSGNPLFKTGSRGEADEALKVFDQLVTNNAMDDNTTVDAAIVSATNLASNTGIAVSSFDIGHLISAQGGGGSGYLGVSCRNGKINDGFDPAKAGGGSASTNPTGSGWVQLVAHEFGHQFDGPHSWNGGTALCGTSDDGSTIGGFCDAFGQYDPANGYEPGAGITLMSYGGICNDHDLQVYNSTTTASKIPYIHGKSIQSMRAHIDAVSCDNVVATTNNAPNITIPNCTMNIPRGTPFELTATATDANNDVLTYSWEQLDLGAQGAPGIGGGTNAMMAGVGVEDVTCDNNNMPTMTVAVNAAMNTGAPTFRSYAPSASPTRSFPIIEKVVALAPSGNLSNTADRDGEVLPNYARTMTFRLTVRDNNGGISYEDVTVTMNANGPFQVTAPNNTTVAAGNQVNVAWSTGGFTDCTNVNIKLSTDGGLTYPINLGQFAYNNLSQMVTIPQSVIATTNARIRVECADNNCATFYNVSGAFTITSNCAAGASNVFPTDLQTFNAGPANLSWSNTGNRSYSTIATSVMASFTSSDLGPQSPVANAEGSSTCQSVSFRDYKHKIYTFKVDKTGDYTFTRSPSGFTIITVFNNFTSYNESDACDSGTFLGSSVYFNGMNYSGLPNVSLTLMAGVTYTLLVGRENNSNVDISFSGPGNVLLEGTDPGASYSYTYVLVSDADGLIKDVSPTADFGTSGTYTAGTYKVYGISYLTADAANPKVWVGQTIGAVNGTVCLRQSTNFKPLSFTATLPVELLAFEARALETQNRLTWITASEENNAGFEVERSKDGTNWETLDFVKGYGNSLQERNYKYYDIQPLRGVNYYRLKQVDNDGAFEYSNIVSVTTKAADDFAFTLYPNPTKEAFTLELTGDDEPFNLQLIDQLGRVVQEWNQLEGTNHTFDTSRLASGFYTVIARNEQHSFVQRLVKQ